MPIENYIRIRSAKELAFHKKESSNGIYGWFLPVPTNRMFSDIAAVFEYFKGFNRIYSSEDVEGKRFSVRVTGRASEVGPGDLDLDEVPLYLQTLKFLPVLAPPLYVGYAYRQGGISERIKEHLRDGAFKSKLKQALSDADLSTRVSPVDFTVIYFRYTDYCFDCGYSFNPQQEELVLRALERTIFRSYFPLFNSKEGN